MRTVVILLTLSFLASKVPAQMDSVLLGVNYRNNEQVFKRQFLVDITLESRKRIPISIIRDVYQSDFICGMLEGVGIYLEALDSTCYFRWRPDCSPVVPTPELPKKTVKSGELVNYTFDIGRYLKIENGKFVGNYRFKVYHTYYLDSETFHKITDWIYVRF